jgi:hypothetical protein
MVTTVPLTSPITAAYVGALSVGCENCGATPEMFCTKPTGQLRRTPCVARCKAITPDLESSDSGTDSDAAGAFSVPVVPGHPQLEYIDPAEPRHQRDAQ